MVERNKTANEGGEVKSQTTERQKTIHVTNERRKKNLHEQVGSSVVRSDKVTGIGSLYSISPAKALHLLSPQNSQILASVERGLISASSFHFGSVRRARTRVAPRSTTGSAIVLALKGLGIQRKTSCSWSRPILILKECHAYLTGDGVPDC